MKKILLVIFLLGLTVLAPAQKISWLQGKWTGTASQPDAATQPTWKIELTCKGSICNIKYPSFPCGGKWHLQKLESNNATFVEKLSFGQDKCMDNGMVIVKLIDNNYCDVEYYDGKSLIATARIKKEMR